MSLANGPTVMMAIVLLAVQKLAMLTKAAMQSSAPRLLLTAVYKRQAGERALHSG